MTLSNKSPVIPPPDEEPSELTKFREEWKAELQTYRRAHGTELQAANAGHTSTSSKNAPGLSISSQPTTGAIQPPFIIPTFKPRDQGLASTTIPRSHPAVTHDGKVVDQKRARNLSGALDIYRQAVQSEQMGDLDEALLLYRQAFRMDSHVDRAFHREEMLSAIATQHAGLKTATSIIPGTSAHPTEEVTDGITASLQNLTVKPPILKAGQTVVTGALGALVSMFLEEEETLTFKPEDETHPVAVNTLPEEVLVEIMHMLDPTSIERFARVCKKARVLTLESSIWRDLVLSIYKEPQIPDMDTLAEVIGRYMFDHRRLFIEQPRIRMDGVYIAICHYIRPGLSENHWVNISHLITYHRYLRFYPNGQVLSLLANEEHTPQNIITVLKPSLRMKGFYIGTWQLSGTTVILSNLFDASGRYPIPGTIEAPALPSHPHSHTGANTSAHGSMIDSQQTRYVFVMSLNLRSKPLGRWNRLDIQTYDTLNLETSDVTPVALKHERPFWFSKVRSYAY